MDLLKFVFDHLDGVKKGNVVASEITPVFQKIADDAAKTAISSLETHVAQTFGIAPTKTALADLATSTIAGALHNPLESNLLTTWLDSQLLGSQNTASALSATANGALASGAQASATAAPESATPTELFGADKTLLTVGQSVSLTSDPAVSSVIESVSPAEGIVTLANGLVVAAADVVQANPTPGG